MGIIGRSKREEAIPLETACLISNTGELELVPAKEVDRETLEVQESNIYSGIKSVVFAVDPKVLTNKPFQKLILWAILSKRIYTRVHFKLHGEPYTRDLFTGEYVDQEHKERVCKRYNRKPEDISDIDFIIQETAEFSYSGVMKQFWRAAQGRGITFWLPWVICGIISLGAFGAILAQNWMMMQG